MTTKNFVITLLAVLGFITFNSCEKDPQLPDLNLPGEKVIYKDRVHEPIGEVLLQLEGDQLLVSNLNNETGVRINCPEDESMDMYYNIEKFDEASYFEGILYENSTHRDMAGISMEITDGEPAIYGYIDGQDTYLVEGFLNGHLVYTAEVVAQEKGDGKLKRFLKKAWDAIKPCSLHPYYDFDDKVVGVKIDWKCPNGNGNISTPINVTFMDEDKKTLVDEIQISSTKSNGSTTGETGFYTEIKGKNLGQLTISDEKFNQVKPWFPWKLRIGYRTLLGCDPGFGLCLMAPIPTNPFQFEFNEASISNIVGEENGDITIKIDGSQLDDEMSAIIENEQYFLLTEDYPLSKSLIRAIEKTNPDLSYPDELTLMQGEYEKTKEITEDGVYIRIDLWATTEAGELIHVTIEIIII